LAARKPCGGLIPLYATYLLNVSGQGRLPLVTPGKLFAKPDSTQSAGQIILWSESRRLHYNVMTVGWAFLCILVSYVGGNHTWLETPLAILTVLGIQFFANIWYTGGWIADLIVKKVLRISWRGFGPWAFALGTAISFLFIPDYVFT
jgi:hypothetical protein